MAKRNKKKLSKKKQLELQKQRKIISYCLILCLLVFLLTYFIFYKDALKTSVDEVTASYISFNNSKTTDMLKISNLSKMKDKKGKSILNSSTKMFDVKGNTKEKYEIVVYALGNKADESFVKFALYDSNNNEINSGILNDSETSVDGGKAIYQGTIKKHNKLKLNMWLSKKYHGNTKNISYEIKIKPR